MSLITVFNRVVEVGDKNKYFISNVILFILLEVLSDLGRVIHQIYIKKSKYLSTPLLFRKMCLVCVISDNLDNIMFVIV